MLAVLIVIAIGTAVGAMIVVGLGRSRRFNEVDRFHRASAMTSEWARRGVTQPLVTEPDATPSQPAADANGASEPRARGAQQRRR